LATLVLVAEHRDRSQLVGDALREMAVLILVFYSLENGIRGTLSAWGFIIALLGAGGLLYCGIIFEGRDAL